MRTWKRVEAVDGPRFRSAFPPNEASLLKNMVKSVQGMLAERESTAPSDPLEQLTGIRTGNSASPQDATLRRLLPDFVKPDVDDPVDSAAAASLSGALRSLREPEIIEAKQAAAQRLLETLPDDGRRFEITEADANAWIAAVNDVRLALGTIFQIGPDGPDRLPGGDPLAGHLDVYQWLTVLQEYLVLGLMGKSPQ